MGDEQPRPKYISMTCLHCGSRLAPEHASATGHHGWVCSDLCCETVYMDSGLWPRTYARLPRHHRAGDDGEHAGLSIVDVIDEGCND